VAPRAMHELCKAALAGNIAEARRIHFQLLSLHKHLFCEPSPSAAKWALSQLGRIKNKLRLPIVPLTEAGQAQVGAAMREAGLL